MRQYVVDAFTEEIFRGNPAAICIMDKWLSDDMMLNITRENSLAETAFAVKEGDDYKLRWITPNGEIDLCGHATLAAGYVIFKFIEPKITEVNFQTLSGMLKVVKKDDIYEMNFPAYDIKKVEITKEIIEAMRVEPQEAFMGRDLLCILESEDEVRGLKPDIEKVKNLDGLILHVTAQGKNFDCVSRSFAPKINVSEDPVCGSGHCHIIPYWAKKLGKNNLTAYQASQRGGTLYCEHQGDRVKLAGKAALYSTADLNL